MLIALVLWMATATSIPAQKNMAVPASAKLPVTGEPMLIGNWSGDNFALGADADRVIVQSGCSVGRTAGPVSLDKAGRFTAHGYFNPPRTGYQLGDIAPRDRPAEFTGTVRGKTLQLVVTPVGGKPIVHLLHLGRLVKFPAC